MAINNSKRLPEIDAAKGIAIILVVFGHVVARTPPSGNEWYEFSKWLIYLFHMPFFMFLAGLVYGLHEQIPMSRRDYAFYARKKIIRFAPGYALIGSAIVLAKSLGGNFLHIDNQPESLQAGLTNLLVFPFQSGAGFLWFIYVLLAIYLVFPIVLLSCRMKPLPVLILGGLALLLDPTAMFALDRITYFFLFFSLGYVSGTHYEKFCTYCVRFGHFAVIGFLLALFDAIQNHRQNSIYVALLAIPAAYAIVLAFRNVVPNFIIELGKTTFSIYLLNTIRIGIVKAIGLKLAPWDGNGFLIYFPVLLCSGLAIPFLLKKTLLHRFSWI